MSVPYLLPVSYIGFRKITPAWTRIYNERLLKLIALKWRLILILGLAGLIPSLIPVVHMIVFGIIFGRNSVNVSECQCSCWDTVFKGAYENGNVVEYKHVYFNSNLNTFKMWISTVFFIISLYEAFKHFFVLLVEGKVRWTMGVLAVGSIYNQYYAWWSHWNYWNDDFYMMWNHQLFFTLTEAVAFFMVLLSLDKSKDIQPNQMLAISSIACFHICASAREQFVFNVIYGEGGINEVLRDILFMASDLLFLTLSLCELRQYTANKKGIGLFEFLMLRPNLVFICLLFLVMMLFITVFPSDQMSIE